MASAELPDLIIMDINMPQMNGLEAVKNIRQDLSTRDIPIFVSTAEENVKSEFTAEKGREVQGFIEKPYKIDQIVSKIKNLLGN